MKKWLLSSLLFFLIQVGYGQVTVLIELTADGEPIGTDKDALFYNDVEWTVTDVNTGCVLDQEEAYRKFVILEGGVDYGGLTVLMIDMGVFNDCALATEGHELVFEMKIVKTTNKFYGYTAKKSFIVPGGSVADIYRGEDAINFTKPACKIIPVEFR